LSAQVEFLAGDGQDFAAFAGERAQQSGPDHAAVSGDPDASTGQ
jgi:hypothetical protein